MLLSEQGFAVRRIALYRFGALFCPGGSCGSLDATRIHPVMASVVSFDDKRILESEYQVSYYFVVINTNREVLRELG
jgi:hypothetical protein